MLVKQLFKLSDIYKLVKTKWEIFAESMKHHISPATTFPLPLPYPLPSVKFDRLVTALPNVS